MAINGRLLCLCLVLGLVFESLGHPSVQEKRAAEDSKPSGERRQTLTTKHEVDCGGIPCQFGCCENDKCRELDCEHYPGIP
uniref:Teretoxin Tsu6.5 n=1 Tax=Terebra subulata TaxID=89435 RepID=T65_TERSU|nr:RecName: Full=Teretoxin Tsu6.5; Flags: Precursor [Terebra subulata]